VLEGAEPDRRLRLGLIGCGWYGMEDAKAALKAGGVEITGICDVDSDHLNQSARGGGKAARQTTCHLQAVPGSSGPAGPGRNDYRHPAPLACPSAPGLPKAGLDVYCEKPLSYDIRESQAMVAAVKASKSLVQVGFQRRQNAAFKAVRQHIQDGNAGRIVCAEANIHYTAGTKDPTPQSPPPSLDWDLWCGPAPLIPYSPQVGHMNWRLEKTTGHGHLVDWGIHLIDASRVILGEGMPNSVSAAGGLYYLKDRITTPDVLTAHFEFGTCPLTWRHRIWGAEEYTPAVSNGIFLYGEKQTVFCDG
jgi:predicted dehydrogenase